MGPEPKRGCERHHTSGALYLYVCGLIYACLYVSVRASENRWVWFSE